MGFRQRMVSPVDVVRGRAFGAATRGAAKATFAAACDVGSCSVHVCVHMPQPVRVRSRRPHTTWERECDVVVTTVHRECGCLTCSSVEEQRNRGELGYPTPFVSAIRLVSSPLVIEDLQ